MEVVHLFSHGEEEGQGPCKSSNELEAAEFLFGFIVQVARQMGDRDGADGLALKVEIAFYDG